MSTHPSPNSLLMSLDQRLASVLEMARASTFWKALQDTNSSTTQVQSLLRELYLEAYSYHQHVFEAAGLLIGRFPKSSPCTIRKLFSHLADEADHGELALRAHVALGGDENRARSGRLNVGAFTVAAFWRGLAALENPFCYLGAMYLFESSTPELSKDIKDVMTRHQLKNGQEHAIEHIKVDQDHAELFRNLIIEASVDPVRGESIVFGFEAFASIYPDAIFDSALRRSH